MSLPAGGAEPQGAQNTPAPNAGANPLEGLRNPNGFTPESQRGDAGFPTGGPVHTPIEDDQWPEVGEPREGQQNPETPAAPDWDNDANPYKIEADTLKRQQSQFVPAQPPQEKLQAAIASIDREAHTFRQSFNAAVESKQITGEMADAYVAAARENAVLKAQMQMEHEALLPVAREVAARRAAEKFSTREMKLDPKELLDQPTVEAMEAKAGAIVKERRNNNFADRGAKRVDSPGPGQAAGGLDKEALARMSPHDKIVYGLRQGRAAF